MFLFKESSHNNPEVEMDNVTDFFNNTTPLVHDDVHQISRNGLPKWAKIWELTYLIIIGLIGTPGNLLILLVQKRNRNKSSTDYLVVGMAFHELICSSINDAVKILMHIENVWAMIASDTLCGVHFCMVYTNLFASSYLLAAIAVDRCIKTCLPLSSIFTPKRSKVICVVASIAGFIAGITTLFTYAVDDHLVCIVSKEGLDLQLKWDIGVTITIGLVVLVFIVSYTIIALALRKRVLKRKQTARTSEMTSSSTSKFKEKWLKWRRAKVEPYPESSDHTLNTTNIADTVEASSSRDKIGEDAQELEEKYEEGQGQDNSIVSPRRPMDEMPSNSSANKSGNYIKPKPLKKSRSVTQVESTLTRTTRIMFILSVIYIILWTVTSISVHTNSALVGVVVFELSKTFFMINCVSNPILFFSMSSKYRSGAKRLLCKTVRR